MEVVGRRGRDWSKRGQGPATELIHKSVSVHVGCKTQTILRAEIVVHAAVEVMGFIGLWVGKAETSDWIWHAIPPITKSGACKRTRWVNRRAGGVRGYRRAR